MRVYSVHLRRHGLDPDRDFLLIQEGFSWPAFFLGGLWALWHRLWWAAAVLLLGRGVLWIGLVALGASDAALVAVDLAIAIGAGLFGNDLRRARAGRRRYVDLGVVAAEDEDTAERRFLAANPDVTRALAG